MQIFYCTKFMHIGYDFSARNAAVKQFEMYHRGPWGMVVQDC